MFHKKGIISNNDLPTFIEVEVIILQKKFYFQKTILK